MMRSLISTLLVVAAIVLATAVGTGVAQAQSAPPAPTGVQVANGPNPGEANVTWNAAGGVSSYRVGWLAVEDFNTHRANEVWRSYFRYSDVTANSSWTVDHLTPGRDYYFIVGRRYDNGAIGWSAWETLRLNDDTSACPAVDQTQTTTGGQTQTSTFGSAPVGGDYDADDDGLIEIRNLVQLDAIRHDLNGDGTPTGSTGTAAYGAAFPGAADSMGCPAGCTGYELANSLDFGTDISGAGWLPIGGSSGFKATFDGGGHTISNMFIGRGGDSYVGLFGSTRSGKAAVKRLGLVSVTIRGNRYVGGLVGVNRQGTISDSYVTGDIIGVDDVGGLIGLSDGIVTDSYSTAVVSGRGQVGGVLGKDEGGTISDSHATGAITASGNYAGGLIGYATGGTTVSASYASGNVTGSGSAGGLIGVMGSNGAITASYATGHISGGAGSGSEGGGLAGVIGSNSTITASYATGNISGEYRWSGGLVGFNRGGIITASYATGNVNNRQDNYDADSGGLTGDNSGIIIGSYASGDVSGRGRVGGLVGENRGTLTATYSVGRVSFTPPGSSPDRASVGGLVGIDEGGTVNASYWNTQTSGQSDSGGGSGKTTRELQSPTGATGIYAAWNAAQWDFGTSSQYPALKFGGLDVAAQR